MDEIKKEQSMGHGDMCNCGWCMHNHMHGHFGFWIVKLLVALVVLLFVFWLGVKVGEVKSFVGMGRYTTRSNMMYYGGYGTPGAPVMLQQGTVPGGIMRTQTNIATGTPVK